ncbi:MAG: HupE/UreJ family protein [Gammaproteobacteria bacterium]|nr:HupE/UreJ family protein [Gammaproteobacteria bacterium]
MLQPHRTILCTALACFGMLLSLSLYAHPEDEFCVPGEDSLDPALCKALAELDSKTGDIALSEMSPILDDAGNERSIASTVGLYLKIGISHILPGGADHILFVLAMFLASTRWRALLLQVSAFTVAHTVTLALAASGAITPSPQIVEPLIALTIGFVAIENLLFKEMTKWRPAVVFGFGLIHGMGFAGFFGELGLPPGQFWSALIGFNVGVEVGQLLVIVAAAAFAATLRRALSNEKGARQYRQFVVLPGSALIGITGFWWAFERLFS